MAEESKQSGLASDQTKSGNASLDDSFSDLEESLDFDIYVEDIPLIAEANGDTLDDVANSASPIVAHFTDPSSSSSDPIPLNLSSFRSKDNDDYSDIGSKPFSEDDLDDILLKDNSSSQFDEDEQIGLSSSELDHIISDNDDFATDYEDSLESNYQPGGGKSRFAPTDDSFEENDLTDTYDTDLGDDDNITLGSDELDHILNPDEEENGDEEFESKSFFDADAAEENEEDGPIALSDEELNNITSLDDSSVDDFETEHFISEPPPDLFEHSGSNEEEIALSGDELNNLLESGNTDEEEFETGEAKSFFDSEEDDEEIALSPDELNNITDSEYAVEDGIETADLSSGIESNEYGVSTESVFDEDVAEDDDISLSGDELNNILETGEIEVENEEEVEEEFDLENAKSFFDSDEEEQDDESISLSPDELGNITAEEDFELDSSSSENFSSDEANFDLTEETEDLEIESKSDLFDENATEDEEIALSGDELNNLIESGEIETEEEQENEVVEADDSSAHSFFEDASEEDESIALSPDELGNITAEEDFEIQEIDGVNELEQEDNFDLSESTQDLEMEPTPNLFEEETVEDEEIALSGDELNNLLESGDITTEEDDSLGSSFFENSNEEDESIALSPDELGNITAEEDFEVENIEPSIASDEGNFDLSEATDEFEMESPQNLFEEETVEDEEIALSGDELNNLLESGEIETEDAPSNDNQVEEVAANTDYSNPIDSGMVIGDDDFIIDDNSSLSDLGDFNIDDTPDIEQHDYSDEIESFQFGAVKKEELKKVISYMDELLGSLPDSYIKEFASSEYFELYKKIMNELEL
ncbi:MAG: hypothetical protein IPQ05_00565 [Leptospiraceae bacterium]|nr:hypothetical protein [Leptospiraceae bacterium]